MTPTRGELFAGYALDDRATPRVRMNFVSSADGAVTLDDAFEICRQYDLMLPFGAESILPKNEHEVLKRELDRLRDRKRYQLRQDGWPEPQQPQSPPQQAQGTSPR